MNIASLAKRALIAILALVFSISFAIPSSGLAQGSDAASTLAGTEQALSGEDLNDAEGATSPPPLIAPDDPENQGPPEGEAEAEDLDTPATNPGDTQEDLMDEGVTEDVDDSSAETEDDASVGILEAGSTFTLKFDFLSSMNIHSVSMSLRTAGSSTWEELSVMGNYFQTTLAEDTTYEYVFYYADRTNNGYDRYTLYKIFGTLEWDSGDDTVDFTVNAPSIDNVFTVTVTAPYPQLHYCSVALKSGALSSLYANGRNTSFAKYFQVFPSSMQEKLVLTDDAGVRVPPAVYYSSYDMYVLTTNETFHYRVEDPSVATASGSLVTTGADTSNLTISKDEDNHSWAPISAGSFVWGLTLAQEKLNFELAHIIYGTNVEVTPLSEGLTVSYIPGTQRIEYSLAEPVATGTLQLVISRADTATIILEIEVDDTGGFAISNQETAERDASKISLDSATRVLTIEQMAVGEIQVNSDGIYRVVFPALLELANMNGVNTVQELHYYGALRILNNTGVDLYLVGVAPTIENYEVPSLRSSFSPRMIEYYNKIYDVQQTGVAGTRGSLTAEEMYDFENITGKSYYEALLELYNTDPELVARYGGNLTSLDAISDMEFLEEVLGEALWPDGYTLDELGGETSAPYLYPIGNNKYQIKETDPAVIARYSVALYRSCMGITLDNSLFRLFDWDAPEDWNEGLWLYSYLQRNAANENVIKTFKQTYNMIANGGSWDLKNFRYVVNTTLIAPPQHVKGVALDVGLVLEFSTTEEPKTEVPPTETPRTTPPASVESPATPLAYTGDSVSRGPMVLLCALVLLSAGMITAAIIVRKRRCMR